MKILILTDMEGCAGVMNAADWVYSSSRYYEQACELATLEASAAVEGALDAGATEVVVVDAHGPGAMRRSLLHPKALLFGGRPWPRELATYGVDGTVTAMIVVGQHAMSGTDGGHLSHTMSFGIEEFVLNDMPIGEVGMLSLIAGYFNVPVIMVSGDQSACDEARAHVPAMEVAPVKFGFKRGSSKGLSAEEHVAFNSMATHLHPDEARTRIRAHAYRAVKRIPEIAPCRIEGPYRLSITKRASGTHPKPETILYKAADFIDLLHRVRERTAAKHATAGKPTPSAKPAPPGKRPVSPKKPKSVVKPPAAPVKAPPKPAASKPKSGARTRAAAKKPGAAAKPPARKRRRG